MRKFNKLLSVLLAFTMLASIFSVAIPSISAAIDDNGRYVPSEGIGDTRRYYFSMPQEWENEYSTDAGIYWWSGSDACGAVDGSGGTTVWPGYKAQVVEGDVDNLFYVDVPADVEIIIWNNFVNGGEDKTLPIFKKAVQTVNIMSSYYSEGDTELYDNLDDGDFFMNMEESFLGNKEDLGDFADNFFIEEEYGMSFNVDNMIYIIDPSLTSESELSGQKTYGGEWYFYYGDGTYGPYPTKETSIENGLLGELGSEPEITEPEITEPTSTTEPTVDYEYPTEGPILDYEYTTEPTTAPVTPEDGKFIYFDVNSTGWSNVKSVYCHIWKPDGSKTSAGEDWPIWQSRKEKCEFDKTTGIARYDLSKTGHDFKESDGRVYCLIFSVNTGMQTYNTIMSGSCIGDTLYCTCNWIENPRDSEKQSVEVRWKNNPDCGPEKQITSIGNIVGTAYPEGMTDADLIADYLIDYYNDMAKTVFTQQLLNKLKVSPSEVMAICTDRLTDDPDRKLDCIERILDECTDPNVISPNKITLNATEITLGVGESCTLIATVEPENAYSHIIWYSSRDVGKVSAEEGEVTVDSNGNVTAIKAGVTTVFAETDNGLCASCKVTVKNPLSSIELNKTKFTLGVGESYVMSASINDGEYTDYDDISWSSSNKKVLTVSKQSNGQAKVTAKGTGTATVAVETYNGFIATATVTVKKAPTVIKPNYSSFTLGVGESYTVSTSVNSGEHINNHSIEWSNNNSKVVAIKKQSGGKLKITAKAAGKATITVKTYNGKTATITVTVKNAPKSISVNKTKLTLDVGESYVMSTSLTSGSAASNFNRVWTSSNTKVAAVKKQGGGKAEIVAKGAGTATITVKTYNGKTAKATVTVKDEPILKKASNTCKGVKIAWGKVSGAGGYYVYRKSGSSGWTKIATVGKNTSSYVDTKAKSGTKYTYTVRAYSGSYKSGYNTTGLSIKFLTAPKISSAVSSKSGITVKWGKATGSSGYYVYRKTASTGWKKIATVKGISKTSYTDKSAKKGTTYTYTIRAYSGSTLSSYYDSGKKCKDLY